MIEDHKTKPNEAEGQKKSKLPELTIDWKLFGSYLEDSDMTDAEKREIIEALWYMVVSFVDLGFGVHPAQLVIKNFCEQDQQNGSLAPQKASSMVNCSHITPNNTKAGAHQCIDSTLERSPK